MTPFEIIFKLHTLGFSVIPSGKGKSPLVPWTEYQKRQPTDDELLDWNERLNPPLWGIVTGAISGVVVVDADNDKAKALLDTEGLAPHITTPRGGGHYYFKHPGHPVKTCAGILPGLDIRGDGGFVNVVGSRKDGDYRTLILPTPDCLYPWENLPEIISKATNNSKPSLPPSETTPISEGQRNAILASLGGTMRRKGMPREAIEAALQEVNRLQCQPPLSNKEVDNIAKSVSRYVPQTDNLDSMSDITDNLDSNADNTDLSDKLASPSDTLTFTDITDIEKAGKIIWKMVDEWLRLHQGERFDLDTICRQLDINNRDDRHHVVKKLSYEVDHEKLEKSVNVRPSIYTLVSKEYKEIDWLNASDVGILPVKWPMGRRDGTRFGFDGCALVSAGDIIVLAGNSNAGKTAWCLNLLWENMDEFPCTLMGNEYTAPKFKRRVARMDWKRPRNPDGTAKFELIERYEGWKDIIRPNNINIIDWINLGDNFYTIGKIIEGIRSKLNDGIAVIVLQKSEGKQLGTGGGFSEHLASLYLLIDYQRMTVRKCKEFSGEDPNHKMYGFEIAGEGTLFKNIRQVRKCRNCGGRGVSSKGGDCDYCVGKGTVDV